MSRKRVLGAVALFSVAIVAALFVLQRKSTHEAAAPLLPVPGELVTPFDDVKLDSATEEQGTSNSSDRAEVAVPSVAVLTDQPTSPRLRFAVVDAQTLRPVENFGLRVCAPKSDELASTAPFEGPFPFDVEVTIHAGDICELPEDATSRGYQIKAPGYAHREGWLEDSARTPNGQEIRLERGGSIRGRVLLDGKPASSVIARLRPAVLDEQKVRSASRDLSEFLGTRSIGRLEDGELHLTELSTGTYRLELRASHGVGLVLERVGVVVGAETSVGELQLASSPVVNGVVLFPANRVPPKYKLTVSSQAQVAAVRLDADGKFKIDSLPAGQWQFAVPAADGFVCDGVNIVRDIGTTVGQQITIDLTDRTGCWVTARVLVNGSPLRDSYVGLELPGVSGMRAGMPRTGETGESRAWASLHGVTAVFALSPTSMPIARRALDPAEASRDELDVVLSGEVGELTLDWSELAASISQVEVNTRDANGVPASYARERIEIEIAPNDREWHESRGFRVPPDIQPGSPGHRDCGPIGVGAYTVTLTVYARESAPTRSTFYRKEIHVRAGQTSSCVFSLADLRD